MEDEIGFDLYDNMSTRYGNTLAAEFVSGYKIATFPHRPILCNSRDEPTEHAGKEEVCINFIEPEFIFEDPLLRPILSEANATFLTLQNMRETPTNKPNYLQISQAYRCIVRSCIDKLKDDPGSENNRYYISTFYSVEFLWHLCEILYLRPTHGQGVVPNLLEWVRFHFPATESKYSELYELGKSAASREEYWPTLKGLILQCQLESVVSLLQFHPKAATPAFKIAENILTEMPLCKTNLTLASFNQRLNYWRKETESKLQANIFGNEPDLGEIIKLLLVDTETWNKHIKESTSWYALFPGYLYFTSPHCEHGQLGEFAKQWLNRWVRLKGIKSSALNLNQLESTIYSLMEDDFLKGIHSIHLFADNKWFAVHLLDLLYHIGRLQGLEEAIKLREQLLYDFGALLMTRGSFWQMGVDYLRYSSAEGLAAVELLLTKIPIRNERQAMKIIAVAQEYGFTSAEREICVILARKSFNEKRYGNALEWATRSKDSTFVAAIADYLLKYYSKTGEILCPEVIANIGPKIFLTQRLVFLAKYLDFTLLYREKNFSAASDLIMELITSNMVPEYFWPSLLIDCIPLLESTDPKFSTVETTTILHHLESKFIPMLERKKKRLLQNPDESIDIIKDYRIANIEEFIDLLRLACARHLSRAVILESQMGAR